MKARAGTTGRMLTVSVSYSTTNFELADLPFYLERV
jgi:hypothetical protein